MEKKNYFILIVVLFFLSSPAETRPSSSLAVYFTPSTIGQGEVDMLSIQKLGDTKPGITWMGKTIALFSDTTNDVWAGFIGVDLTTKPGRYTLTINFHDGSDPHSIPVRVPSRDYGSRRLSLPKKMVELDTATLKRVRKESKAIRALFTGPDTNPLWVGRWIKPVPGMIVSPFGCKSIINGLERSPHSGVDLKAGEGTPIKATNRGVVAMVADHYFSGLSVVIDHGGGIQSMYFHLSKDYVKVGQLVEKGAVIGLAGSSGRVTGPHLHFGIRLNNGRIDPIKLIEVSGRLER
jgi:hypothetical protein